MMMSDVNDLARFMSMIFVGGTVGTDTIISKETLDSMMRQTGYFPERHGFWGKYRYPGNTGSLEEQNREIQPA
ncbi:MAG: hypothetical protein KJ607_13835 [Bacteroidetes bacterium]|nr:hypothetical protein [Bacteroidota bacterium]